MTTWFVAAQDPGTSSLLDAAMAVVNFWVRIPAGGRGVDAIKELSRGRHEMWDAKTPAVQTRFARQLYKFANAIATGDTFITLRPANRDDVMVGEVTGEYRYEDPPTIPGHPHVREVNWIGRISREALPDNDGRIRNTRGLTVRFFSGVAVEPSRAIDGEVPAPHAAAHFDRPGSSAQSWPRSVGSPPSNSSSPDRFEWSPEQGPHRYILRHGFRGAEPSDAPLVVVMLNPAANHLPGFRRSATCHAVRRWGMTHGHTHAIYINLFSYIEPNSARLRDVPLDQLNGPEADEVIRAVAAHCGRHPVLAGWGNVPPGLNRTRYDERVRTVQSLFGRPLMCLGLTEAGYPRHGRWWRQQDLPTPLRSQ